MSGAYYNEFDPYAAQWLRNLIKAGLIAPGDVDERSIEDVIPSDLADYTQCHFFAGVGVWSLALRGARWDDTRPVWTGSCPCQPFSSAGEGLGFADERHLWPSFNHLITECRPAIVFGEQVAAKAVEPWVDLVHADLEGLDYAFGCIPFSSAGVGAPHIRDRAYWSAVGLADSDLSRLEGRQLSAKRAIELSVGSSGLVGGMAYSEGQRWSRRPADTEESAGRHGGEECGSLSGMAHPDMPKQNSGRPSGGEQSIRDQHSQPSQSNGTGPTNGWWRDADWIGCTDGFWRPVESGAFPLANGIANRMGKLRAYGNAINAQQAKIWIETVMECIG